MFTHNSYYFSCQDAELLPHHPKRRAKNKRRKSHQKHQDDEFDDPYEADDESDNSAKRDGRSINNANNNVNRLVLKVVKQGDYRHKQSHDSGSGLAVIEQDMFLPRNLTLDGSSAGASLKSSGDRRRRKNDDDDEYYEDDVKASKRAVFEVPRKPPPSYTKWSKWTKCTPKCTTRRFKKCKPHARHICGNDVIREIAYCYIEGSFCEEWINSQLSRLEQATTTTTTTTRRTTVAPKVESAWSNAIPENWPVGGGNKKPRKPKQDSKPQNFQCGFPSIRSKNDDFLLKIIGGRTARRGQVRQNENCEMDY